VKAVEATAVVMTEAEATAAVMMEAEVTVEEGGMTGVGAATVPGAGMMVVAVDMMVAAEARTTEVLPATTEVGAGTMARAWRRSMAWKPNGMEPEGLSANRKRKRRPGIVRARPNAPRRTEPAATETSGISRPKTGIGTGSVHGRRKPLPGMMGIETETEIKTRTAKPSKERRPSATRWRGPMTS
jgi:hypothetical protein